MDLGDAIRSLLGQKKIISPLPPEDSPGGYNSQLNPVIDYYTQREAANEALAKEANIKAGIRPRPTMQPTPQSTTPTQQVLATQTVNQPAQTDNQFKHFTTAKIPDNVKGLIYKAAVDNNVDPNVLASLLFSEHGFQTDAKRNYNTDGSYDRGIAQINTAAHPEISEAQALDPNFAVNWAAKTLGGHIKKLGVKKGIAAYNVCEGGATVQGIKGPLGPKGQAYVDKVSAGLTPELRQQLGL